MSFEIYNLTVYGGATKYRVDKNILRALYVGLMVLIPLVTPLALYANKLFKNDYTMIQRHD